jgi:hypothetical protein
MHYIYIYILYITSIRLKKIQAIYYRFEFNLYQFESILIIFQNSFLDSRHS